MSDRILATGAAGFIGFHLARRLLADGYAVVGVDDLNDYYDPQLKRDRLAEIDGEPGFSFEKLDLADRGDAAVLVAFEGCMYAADIEHPVLFGLHGWKYFATTELITRLA